MLIVRLLRLTKKKAIKSIDINNLTTSSLSIENIVRTF